MTTPSRLAAIIAKLETFKVELEWMSEDRTEALLSLVDDLRDNYSDDRVTDPDLCLLDACLVTHVVDSAHVIVNGQDFFWDDAEGWTDEDTAGRVAP